MKAKLQIIKAFLGGLRTNLNGIRLNEKLLIIESDDWGAIRTPSAEAAAAFKKKGLDIGNNIYRVDALASEEDLNSLFDLLSQFKDISGNPAIFTANAIMANPDFDKIKATDFREYHYEVFTETFKRYSRHANNLEIWKKGITEKVFYPQFHGREHLNIKRWLKVLQAGNEAARFCFDWRTTYSGKEDYSFMEAFDWDQPKDVSDQITIIMDGLRIFKETFGFVSDTFIAPCYNWDPKLEKHLAEFGINWLQGVKTQYVPTGEFGKYWPVRHNFGEKNKDGIIYNIRNCTFEPAMNPHRDWVNTCMAQISAAFLSGKPAVITSHRINYVGYIEPKNRDRGLKHLHALLSKVIRKWPDIKFISTNQLNQYLHD